MRKLKVLAFAMLILYCGFLTYQINNLKGKLNESEWESVSYVNKTVTGFSTDITKVISETASSTVHVTSYSKGTKLYSGSGFITLSDEGKSVIVTSAKFVSEADQIVVRFDNGEEVDGLLAGYDSLTDLAVVITNPTFTAKTVKAGKSSQLSLGEWLVAVGSEGRTDYSPSISIGLLSGKNRPYQNGMSPSVELNVMVADLELFEGTVGSAVVNMQGELVGALTNLSQSAEGALIVPVEEVEEVVRMILSDQQVVRPSLGITTLTVQEMTAYQKSQLAIQLDQIEGLYINSMEHLGACDLALMQIGDILLEIDGIHINDYDSLRSVVYAHKVGDVVELTILRGNDQMKVMVTLQ